MTCKGLCIKYKALKPLQLSRYLVGQKRCNTCSIFLEWDGLFCPCCNVRLRTTSRYTKYKERFIKIKRI